MQNNNMKVSVIRGKSIPENASYPILNVSKSEMTIDKYYMYCRLKLKDYIFKKVGTDNQSLCTFVNNVIDSIPSYMFDSLDKETSMLLLLNYIIYSTASFIAFDQNDLFTMVIKFLYQYDPRL